MNKYLSLVGALLLLVIVGFFFFGQDYLRGQETTAKNYDYATTAPSSLVTFKDISASLEPTNITFTAGHGASVTLTAEGKVVYNGTVDAAAKTFWDAVGTSFPEFRRTFLAGYHAHDHENIVWLNDVLAAEFNAKKFEWVRTHSAIIINPYDGAPGFSFRTDTGAYSLGFRADGVVVWRKAEKAK